MANLEYDQIEFISNLIADYIQNKLKKCSIEQKEANLTEPEAIVKEIWNRLMETHRLKIVG